MGNLEWRKYHVNDHPGFTFWFKKPLHNQGASAERKPWTTCRGCDPSGDGVGWLHPSPGGCWSAWMMSWSHDRNSTMFIDLNPYHDYLPMTRPSFHLLIQENGMMGLLIHVMIVGWCHIDHMISKTIIPMSSYQLSLDQTTTARGSPMFPPKSQDLGKKKQIVIVQQSNIKITIVFLAIVLHIIKYHKVS